MNGENAIDSTCSVSNDELTKRFVEAIRIDNEIKKIKGVPIQKYDHERNNRIWSIRTVGGNMLKYSIKPHFFPIHTAWSIWGRGNG